MFSYLRYFSIISAVVITLAAIALGYYFRSDAGDDLHDLVTKNNRVLVQGFINNVWKEHPMVNMLGLFRKHNVPKGNWHKYRGYKENFENFNRDVFKYFEEMPVVHVEVYDGNGEKLLAFNQSKILEDNAKGVRSDAPSIMRNTLISALKGSTDSAVITDADFQIANGSYSNGTLVQTAKPILSDSYVPLVAGADKKSSIQGVVVIYYDITRQWQQLANFQYLGTGAIIGIFFLLLGTLIVVAKKAEKIIAKQHEANVELAAQASAAEAENENKSQFLASISHELRTPLNAIIGFSEIIKNESMGAIGNDQYKDYIKDIHNSGVHLLSLINDILDYSKAEAGKLDLIIDEVDITKLIHASMRLVSPRAELAKVELVPEIPKEHYLLHTDGKKVKQVLLNLLSNAVKFTPEGGKISVTLWQDVMDNSLSVEVKDSGIGIAEKDISKALSPFGQVDSALSRKYEGTGLGLPLTKKFVEIMGGAFEIESEEGKGTAIRFSLPLKNAVIAEAKESKLEKKAPAPQKDTASAPAQPAAAQPLALQTDNTTTVTTTGATQAANLVQNPANPTPPATEAAPPPMVADSTTSAPATATGTAPDVAAGANGFEAAEIAASSQETPPAISQPGATPLQQPAPEPTGFSAGSFELATPTNPHPKDSNE